MPMTLTGNRIIKFYIKSLYVQHIYTKLLVLFILFITTFHSVTTELCLTGGAALTSVSEMCQNAATLTISITTCEVYFA